MSQIQITMDTETKRLDVMLDGENISGVTSISIYADRNEDGTTSWSDADISVRETTDKGVRKNTSYYAAGSNNEKRLSIAGLDRDTTMDGFVGFDKEVVSSESVKKDILEYMNRCRSV